MKTVETLNEGLKRAYTLTIPAKDIDAAVDREVKSIAPTVKMPGFRPGKVPANLVRKMHGVALSSDALNKSIQAGVQKVLAEHKLRPAIQPSVALGEGYEPGKDAEVTVELEVLPEIATPSIDGLTLERLTVPVADAAVDEALANIAAQQTNFTTAPKATKAAKGDQIVIDFEGKIDGEPFDGGKGEGMAVTLGSGQLIPGFEDQMVGLKANDAKLIKVSFPDDYHAKNLAGKPATFDIVVGEVRKSEDTKTDDALAKSLGLDGIDKLKELLRGNLEQELSGLTRTHMKRKLLDQLAASHDFAVPPSMVEAEFSQIWQQLDHEASHEPDPKAARKEMEGDREDYHKIAERRVRLGLLLSQIGQEHKVDITPQEMNRLIMQAAQQYRPEDREKFVQYVRQDAMAAAQLRAPLYEDKVVDFLFEKATITDREATREEIEADIEADDDGHIPGPDCGHDHAAKPAATTKKPATAKKAVAIKDAPKSAAKAKIASLAADAKPATAKKHAAKAPAKKAALKK